MGFNVIETVFRLRDLPIHIFEKHTPEFEFDSFKRKKEGIMVLKLDSSINLRESHMNPKSTQNEGDLLQLP